MRNLPEIDIAKTPWAKALFEGFLKKIELMSYQDLLDEVFMPPSALSLYKKIYPVKDFPERYPKDYLKEVELEQNKKVKTKRIKKMQNQGIRFGKDSTPEQPNLFLDTL